MKGDYRALYEVWLKYAYPENEDDEDEWPKPPKPKEQNEGKKIIVEFAEMLELI